MEFPELLELVADEPVFETSLLLAGAVDPNYARQQLSRWTKAGKLYQLRRGLYVLAPPFQRVKPHPFLVANRMVPGSYVSLQSALSYHGLIPEYVALTTSVGTMRPTRWDTPLGAYEFRHIKNALFWGYVRMALGGEQWAFVAMPEKALLDLLHLHPGADSPDYLRELRLQNLGQVDLDRLARQAEHTRSAKLRRAAAVVAEMARSKREYEEL